MPGFGRHLVEVYLGQNRVVVIIMAVLSAVGLWTLGRRSRRVAAALAASIGVVAAAVLLLWQVIEPYDLYPRFFVAMAPFLAALAAFGVHAIPARLGVVAGALAVALLVPNVGRGGRSQTDDPRSGGPRRCRSSRRTGQCAEPTPCR